jgi:hypothetical protein
MFRCGLLLFVVGLLSSCGSSTPSGMKIACSRGTSVEPLPKFEVRQVPAIGSNAPSALLSYPDPLHPDQTGTLTLAPGERCAVTPSTKS